MPIIVPLNLVSAPPMSMAEANYTSSVSPRKIIGRWLDEHDVAIGSPISVPLATPHRLEFENADGGYSMVDTLPPTLIRKRRPSGAVALSLRYGDIGIGTFSADQVTNVRAPVGFYHERMGPNDRPANLYIIGDRYADKDPFIHDAHQTLDRWNNENSPFNRASTYNLVAEALFWPSTNTTSGNFNTVDPPVPGPGDNPLDGKFRIIQGDRSTIIRYIQSAGFPLTDDTLVLILVNSDRYAGAGGMANRHVQGWMPCYVTKNAVQYSSSVALHEIGHAFGLLDEYDTPYDGYTPPQYQPNVSANADGHYAPAPWCQMLTAFPNPNYNRLFPQNTTDVGTFQGALYDSTKYFRPAANCKMRTPSAPFCPVCEELIGRALVGQ